MYVHARLHTRTLRAVRGSVSEDVIEGSTASSVITILHFNPSLSVVLECYAVCVRVRACVRVY